MTKSMETKDQKTLKEALNEHSVKIKEKKRKKFILRTLKSLQVQEPFDPRSQFLQDQDMFSLMQFKIFTYLANDPNL